METTERITESQVKELANWLSDHGFTDGVDVSPEESLVEYGMLRNPDTGLVVYCQELPEGYNDQDYWLQWTEIDMVEVKEDLADLGDDFYAFIGSDRQTELAKLNSNHLAGIINSVNSWNGRYKESAYGCLGMSIDQIKTHVLSRSK